MSPPTAERRPPDQGGAALNETTGPTSATISARCDADRRLRIRRHAARALNELLGLELPPLVLVDRGDYWREIGMDLGWVERHHRGRELAEVGWTP